MINGKDYKLIDYQDIVRLVESKISESKTLDYKREINIEKGDERKDFLFDIASFANSDGGAIIFGVSETKDESGKNTGIPDKIVGLNIENYDKLIQKIEDLIRSSIEPNISNVSIKVLSNENNNSKLLFIGIPKSIGLPRMVTYNDSNKFYKRRNSGKYLLDVFELNQFFMSNLEMLKQVEEYRKERIKSVCSLEFLADINPQNSTFIHVIPISYYSYNQLSLTDRTIISKINTTLRPIGSNGCDYRHNFEGYLLFDRRDKITRAYVQLFRNGIIEFFTHVFHAENEQYKLYYLPFLEEQMIGCIQDSIQLYKFIGIEPPYVIQLTIMDSQKRFVTSGANSFTSQAFSTNSLYIPNLLVNEFDTDISKELKSTFDIIWQSAGYEKSPYYTNSGERKTI